MGFSMGLFIDDYIFKCFKDVKNKIINSPMIFLIYSVLFCAAILYIIKKIFKWERKKEINNYPTVPETPKINYDIAETLIDVLCKIPIFAHNRDAMDTDNLEGESIEANVDVKDSCIILEGEVSIYFKKTLICVKKRGEMIFSSFKFAGINMKHISMKTNVLTRILKIDEVRIHKFLIFSMLAKKSMEISAKYFRLAKNFVQIESGFKAPRKVNKKELVVSINKRLRLENSNIEKLENSIIFRNLKKGEVFKKKDCFFNDLIIAFEGEIVVETNNTAYSFICGQTFGYYSLFFNVYPNVEIKSSRNSKIGILTYDTLCNFGLSTDRFDSKYLSELPPIFHAIDLCCEWLCIKPGGIVVAKNEDARNVFFLNDGKIRSNLSRVSSGCHIGSKEAILGGKFKETYIALKTSDVIKIPFTFIEYFFLYDRTYYQNFCTMLFQQNKEKKGKIITVISSGKDVNIKLFSRRLKACIGKSCLLLNRNNFAENLSKKVFESCEEQSFMSYLNIMARMNDCIIIYLENEYSRLFNYLLKFTDFLLVIGETFQFECFDTYCRIEYVKLYEERRVLYGNNKIKMAEKNNMNRCTFPTRVHHVVSPSRTILFCTKDYERLARYLLKKRIGLVLSGGAARGFAHIGVIQALEEEGIPIDVIGGTSMGSFIGALYARELDNSYVFKESKKFAARACNIFNVIFDFTYPLCSLFSGRQLNKTLKDIFKDELIQNLWIEFFCITTDISMQDEKIHRSGIIWKYLRSSMGLCGYLPPIKDNGSFLVDGGYTNNIPVDAMLGMNVEKVIAVDVGTVPDNDYDDFGEDHNGFSAVLQKYLGTKKFLTMDEIQYRIAFLSSDNKNKMIKNHDKVLFIIPDLGENRTKDFGKFDEIVASGYQAAKKEIEKWKMNGTFSKYLDQKKFKNCKRRYSV